MSEGICIATALQNSAFEQHLLLQLAITRTLPRLPQTSGYDTRDSLLRIPHGL